ncbi:MAG TPA: selenide, water dikinase SelD [Gammaproteobacteria bacterium]|nr:selenide, water dikinase SelD [Gammaproteobacteria bacterium]
MQMQTPNVRDLLLLGGGHSHVQVLKHFAMHPVPGVRLTLISDDYVSPYSGMVPGYIAGHYSLDEIQIALGPLCRRAGARFICANVTGLDRDSRRVLMAGRPALRYDVLSINSGAQPDLQDMPGIAVKPIGSFLSQWPKLLATMRSQLAADSSSSGRRMRGVMLVGAGAGGIELAFACRASLPAQVPIKLVGPTLLPGSNRIAKKLVRRAMCEKNIVYITQRVTKARTTAEGFSVTLANETIEETEQLLWVTDVCAPDWLAESGLDCDDKGFVSVNESMQSINDSHIFVAGDAAHLQGQERAKAGVFAVRVAPILAKNLARAVQGLPLQGPRSRFKPQSSFLTLIGLGAPDRPDAIAIRGSWASRSKIFWRLKERIDRRFVRRFNELPEMEIPSVDLPEPLAAALPDDPMRCGGCGAKLAANPLRRVLQKLPSQSAEHVSLGIGDDAAEVRHGTGTTLLSVDGFRAMLDDPYLLGRICAHHSLNDLYAMGAQPTSALALATIPLMAEPMMEDDLHQLLRGVVDVLNASDTPLVGGHSAEGAELSIALTVTGTPGQTTLTKSGAQVGDMLLLTKPLGTGIILAGAMRGMHVPGAIAGAVNCMDTSNALSVEILRNYAVNALTDVTGFGLLGHLSEILRGSDCGVSLHLNDIPLLPGALLMAKQGIASSLQASNALVLADFTLATDLDAEILALLSDPQTSGGLLASVPAHQADSCLTALRAQQIEAAMIGEIVPSSTRRIS